MAISFELLVRGKIYEFRLFYRSQQNIQTTASIAGQAFPFVQKLNIFTAKGSRRF
jgi:hypothetical protein